jgi:hypothetical protein
MVRRVEESEDGWGDDSYTPQPLVGGTGFRRAKW